MIGGSPMMHAPVYQPTYPMTYAQPAMPQQYAQPYAPQPAAQQPMTYAQPSAPASTPYAGQSVVEVPTAMPESAPAWQPQSLPQADAPKPIVRGMIPEEPATPAEEAPPAPLTMPSPEQLGIAKATANPTDADWSQVHRRLSQLGAVCVHLEKLPQGGYQLSCLLPTAQQGKTHRIDVTAGSESEVVQLTLDKAEEWWAGGR